LNLTTIRSDVDASLDPAWVTAYGDEAWRAALALIRKPPGEGNHDSHGPESAS
jgi:hypothetical protein